MLVFIQIKHPSNKEHSVYFLKYIGGQSLIHCNDHKVPLLTSYNKYMQCCCHVPSPDIENFNEMRCNRRAQYCCPVIGCKSGVCTHCFLQMNEIECTLIQNISLWDNHLILTIMKNMIAILLLILNVSMKQN